MNYRLIDREIHRDQWFRKLSLPAKALWIWLFTNCDCAGIVDLDIERVSFDLAHTIDETHVAEFKDRLQPLPDGKFWIKPFIRVQYGSKSGMVDPRSKIMVPVMLRLEKYGIDISHMTTPQYAGAKSQYTYEKPHASPIAAPSSTRSPIDGGTGSLEGANVHVNVHRKISGRKEGVQGEETKPPSTRKPPGLQGDIIETLQETLGDSYGRSRGDPWSYAEQCLLLEVGKRPKVLTELEELMVIKPKRGKYFPHTIESLLTNWTRTLDAARNGQAHIPDPEFQLKQLEHVMATHVANEESMFYDANCGKEKRREFRELLEKMEKLRLQIANA